MHNLTGSFSMIVQCIWLQLTCTYSQYSLVLEPESSISLVKYSQSHSHNKVAKDL